MAKYSVRFLGARGSMPVAGAQVAQYGGNTSCVFVSMGEQAIVLDAGSGLLKVTPELLGDRNRVSVLLSHTHIDHIIGLPFANIMFNESLNIDIYGAKRGGKTIQAQIECLLSPPLWPVGFETFKANISCHSVESEFWLGQVHVQMLEAYHPGGCVIFRLECDGKSLVYATDNEMDAVMKVKFSKFAKGCNVLICDGQYSQEEYQNKVGYGHTGRDVAVQMALDTQCEQFVLFHHDPGSTDENLQAVQKALSAVLPNGVVAKEDMELPF